MSGAVLITIVGILSVTQLVTITIITLLLCKLGER